MGTVLKGTALDMSHEYAMCLFLWTHKQESWDSSLICQKFLQNCFFFYLKIPININCQQNINRNVIYSKIIARKCNMMRIFHHRLQDLLMSSTHLLLFLIFGILLVVTSYALYFPFCLILAPHALFWQNLPAAYSKRDKLRDTNRC